MITVKIITEYIESINKKNIPTGEKFNLTKENLEKLFKEEINIYSVLGIDVYKYSKYDTLPQALIPYLFTTLLKDTIENVIEYEKPYFNSLSKIIYKERFINTGDGGFIIFDNPLQSIIFSIYFQANLSAYNTANSMPLIYEMIKEISLRYAITSGPLFSFEKNWYGSAIINNSRILSKDRLNRCLIDDFTKKWFDIRINGIENLQIIGYNDIKRIKNYNQVVDNSIDYKSNIIPKEAEFQNSIRTINISKIGEVFVKNAHILIHNLHMQVFLNSPSSPEITKFIITLGNLNVSGLHIE